MADRVAFFKLDNEMAPGAAQARHADRLNQAA